MNIIWTSDAEEQLRPVLSVQIVAAWEKASPGDRDLKVAEVLVAYRNRIDEILAATFDGNNAKHVLVTRLMRGYRRRPDLFLLLVEVIGGSRHGRHVVKIGSAEKLDDEYRRWQNWREFPLQHDVILLTVQSGASIPSTPASDPGVSLQLTRSLVYADANQHIGADRIVTLDEALTSSILYETPSLSSVVSVLDDVYERLGRLMYDLGVERGPNHVGYVLEIKHLEKSLKMLESGVGQRARKMVNEMPQNCRGSGKYFDPAGHLKRIVLPRVTYRGEDGATRQSGSTIPALPNAAALVPGMLVGQAHGDLHARNIQVGIVDDCARWPAIFDYEDMSPANYVGWDFVKMESELKVRIYPRIFFRPAMAKEAGSERRQTFAATVRDFEERLNILTERCRNEGWYEADDIIRLWTRRQQGDETLSEFELQSQRSAARLAVVLLAIRRQAHRQLGVRHDRVSRWLEEYYFLLLCYGVSMMRFENLELNERIGSLVSAGCAASRLSCYYNIG